MLNVPLCFPLTGDFRAIRCKLPRTCCGSSAKLCRKRRSRAFASPGRVDERWPAPSTPDLKTSFARWLEACMRLYPQVRTVFEMGGETSKYIRLGATDGADHLGILDYQSSTECAAGTGSFIDQQASRLLYEVEDVGAAARGASCAARVAGRCSVFAKTDMIHAQQKGYTADQILRGLCEAVARNFKSSIVKGRQVVPPVAFVGGVALNAGVRDAIREAFRLQESDFLVPELHCWMTALGASMLAAEGNGKRQHEHISPSARGAPQARRSSPPPKHSRSTSVTLLRDRVPPIQLPEAGSRVDAYLGIDVGSVSTNLVVIDSTGNLLKEIYVPTAGRPIEVVSAGLREIEEELGARVNIRGVGTTGSGRELIGELTGADTVNDEITAHKTGAMHVCHQLGMPLVDTIFEIGGQDSKFIRIRDGVVVDFAMNEACAAGTGSFLEEQAEKLGVAIKGEFAQLALSSRNPIRLGERCTVFMARDVSSLLLKGAAVADLCAGLAYSVALNYLNRVVRGRNLGNVIYFQGGTAYNDAVAAAFSVILKKPIVVPPHNGVIGAIGMALIARDRMRASGETSRFRGFDLNRVNFTSRDFVCRACSNYCEMKEFLIDGEKSYWGDQCSDKFRKRSRTDRQPVIEDLLSCRDKLLEAALEPPKSRTENGRYSPRHVLLRSLPLLVYLPAGTGIQRGGFASHRRAHRGQRRRTGDCAALFPDPGGARACARAAEARRGLHSAAQHSGRGDAVHAGGVEAVSVEPDPAVRGACGGEIGNRSGRQTAVPDHPLPPRAPACARGAAHSGEYVRTEQSGQRCCGGECLPGATRTLARRCGEQGRPRCKC